jgi:hypothetical protein
MKKSIVVLAILAAACQVNDKTGEAQANAKNTKKKQ